MQRVGVRELKNSATRIVRAVREEHAEYVVTVNGEPVAVLRPYTAADESADQLATVEEYLAQLDELGTAITAAWQSTHTAADAVSEQRR